MTLDTTSVGFERRSKIEAAGAGKDVELRHTSVTDRETEKTPYATQREGVLETGVYDESRWDHAVWAEDPPIKESLVLDESRLGSAVIGNPGRFEEILKIIGDGSFPPPGRREDLTSGQLHQLRDAMILEAHAREQRDVFVSDDVTAFVNHGRRAQLEELCGTKIMTTEEFCRSMRS